MGITYALLKTIPKVQTEFSITILSYDLKRSISKLGHDKLKQAFKRAIINVLNNSAVMKKLTNTTDISIHRPSQTLSQLVNFLNR